MTKAKSAPSVKTSNGEAENTPIENLQSAPIVVTKAEQSPSSKISAAAQAAAALGLAKPLITKYIDPTLIDRREGWNPRFNFGEIELLAASIKTEKAKDGYGLINDIRVKTKPGGRYELVDGDRRLTAVEMLMKRGVTFTLGIPAKVENRDATDMDLLIRMFTANTGKPFDPIEEAAAFKRMRDGDPENGVKGMTIKQIEQATGRSDNSIVGALALLDSDSSLQDAVKTGKVGATLGKSIAVNARGDKQKQAELTAAAIAAGKDGKKKQIVKRAVDESRRAKAAKKGLVLKIRALSDAELSVLGATMSELLVSKLAEAELDIDTNIRKLIKADVRLAMAATFGALEALKAAAGVKTNLDY